MIIASLTSCQAKQLLFTIFLWDKFVLSPHPMKFQFHFIHSLFATVIFIPFSFIASLNLISVPLFLVDDLASSSWNWCHPVELPHPPATISFSISAGTLSFPHVPAAAKYSLYQSGKNFSACILEPAHFSSYDCPCMWYHLMTCMSFFYTISFFLLLDPLINFQHSHMCLLLLSLIK